MATCLEIKVGREGGREEGREGRKEGCSHSYVSHSCSSSSLSFPGKHVPGRNEERRSPTPRAADGRRVIDSSQGKEGGRERGNEGEG